VLLEDFETFERRLGYADFTEHALRYRSNESWSPLTPSNLSHPMVDTVGRVGFSSRSAHEPDGISSTVPTTVDTASCGSSSGNRNGYENDPALGGLRSSSRSPAPGCTI